MCHHRMLDSASYWVSVEVIPLQRFSQGREHEHVVPASDPQICALINGSFNQQGVCQFVIWHTQKINIQDDRWTEFSQGNKPFQ